MQATISAHMFNLVEMNKITVPLGPNITPENNMVYVQDFLANLLKTAFPHLNE
jgi:exportin-1